MRIAIIDDELESRESLKKHIEEWAKDSHINVSCDLFEDGDIFLKVPDTTIYDIIFLDLFMGECFGIDTADELRKTNQTSLLVILTSSQEHLMEAFKYRAFDYVFKPLKLYRLHRLLNEALQWLPSEQPSITFMADRQEITLFYSDIAYITSDRNYCVIHTATAEYRYRCPFAQLSEDLLKDSQFLAINRGVLVNMAQVSKMEDKDCYMKDGSMLPLNSRKASALEQALLNYRFEVRRKRSRNSDGGSGND